mmetsp:Transcript_4254/g.15704  ORF Transcript_4254/g.15704 Transcript_4254/m.15704 type:complete len:209 (-) Transcript_4254:146-772(-)
MCSTVVWCVGIFAGLWNGRLETVCATTYQCFHGHWLSIRLSRHQSRAQRPRLLFPRRLRFRFSWMHHRRVSEHLRSPAARRPSPRRRVLGTGTRGSVRCRHLWWHRRATRRRLRCSPARFRRARRRRRPRKGRRDFRFDRNATECCHDESCPGALACMRVLQLPCVAGAYVLFPKSHPVASRTGPSEVRARVAAAENEIRFRTSRGLG